MKKLFLRKPLNSDFNDEERHGLKRHLGSVQLTAIGIGAIIGAGIFVITGQAAADYAGPSVIISFIIAAIICIFAGLCYAELSALIPISGGSYSYSYVSMGEFPAWIVGWTLIAQCMLSISTVAVGWSGYCVSLLNDFGVTISDNLAHAPIVYSAKSGWEFSGAILNVPAMILIGLVTILISVGIKAAAHFNHVMVAVKLCTIALFILLGISHIDTQNWVPFIPPNTGTFGEFGWSGILRGAGLIFFAYIGFDTVSTLAQDAKKPQKDLPRGILGSLAICTVAYIVTALILTGVVHYNLLGVADPMSVALNAMGPKFFWLSLIVKLAILAGLTTVVLVQSLGQTRIFFAIGKDGLLPRSFSNVNKKTRTPIFASILTGLICLIIAGLFPVGVLGELVSMTTLLLFAIVCAGVLILRYRHPEIKRPFKVPFVPVVPILGIVACIAQMCFLPPATWVQLVIWMAIGLIIYFSYSIRKSKIQKEAKNHHGKLSDTLF
jgi:basic amino acid/polyamine antiporter, APA family